MLEPIALPSVPASSVFAKEDDLEQGVAHTARWTAAMRCIEHEQPNALFSDPLARDFAGESAVEKWRIEMTNLYADQQNAKSHIAIRARALDDIMAEELQAMLPAKLIQVVSLGAGMCTRPWRLEAPGTDVVWFEVDRPDSMRLKSSIASNQRIHPSVGSYCPIGLDFSRPDASLTVALEENNFDTRAPTIVVMEGLLPYLYVKDVEELAEEINILVKAKVRLVMTVINDGFYRELRSPDTETQKKYPGTNQVSVLFHSSWEDGIQEAFESTGWSLVSIISREDYARERLGVEMIRYSFPDRRTSTEYIIVMCRQKPEVGKTDCGHAVLCAALADDDEDI